MIEQQITTAATSNDTQENLASVSKHCSSVMCCNGKTITDRDSILVWKEERSMEEMFLILTP